MFLFCLSCYAKVWRGFTVEYRDRTSLFIRSEDGEGIVEFESSFKTQLAYQFLTKYRGLFASLTTPDENFVSSLNCSIQTANDNWNLRDFLRYSPLTENLEKELIHSLTQKNKEIRKFTPTTLKVFQEMREGAQESEKHREKYHKAKAYQEYAQYYFRKNGEYPPLYEESTHHEILRAAHLAR